MSDLDEAIKLLSTEQGRKKVANALYSTEHKDFRGRSEHGRSILAYDKGTRLFYIDDASADTLRFLLEQKPQAVKKLMLKLSKP